MVICIVLIAWVAAFTMFVNYWGKIRFSSLPESRFRRVYKNLESIKIVKKNTDMVIYKSYTKELSRTMIARERRLQRMSTMPNIKIGEHDNRQSHVLSFVTRGSCWKGDQNGHNLQIFKSMPSIEIVPATEEQLQKPRLMLNRSGTVTDASDVSGNNYDTSDVTTRIWQDQCDGIYDINSSDSTCDGDDEFSLLGRKPYDIDRAL